MTSPTSVPLGRRLFGLGSLFGKTLRDSRRAILIVAGFCSMMVLVSGAFVASQWATEATRAEGVALTTALPAIFTGLYGGSAVSADTLGGFTNWRYGLIFFVLPGVWSLMALSGTLVNEMRRGSMDLLAAGPADRRSIALAKLGGHVAAMSIAMVAIGVVFWLVGIGFATLPGDEIPLGDALGYVLLMGLGGLAAGSIAFALAPFLGRGGAAGVAALVLVGSWVINGYRESLPIFDALAPVSWFSWTAGHRPIAGTSDWLPLLWLVVITGVASTVGVLAFERRDIGQVGAVRLPSMPRFLLGTTGPLLRSFSERLTGSVAWGLGIGVYAIIIATSAPELQRVVAESPTLADMMRVAFPNADLGEPGFALQVLFVQLGTLLIGFAAAAIVGGWASDESDGRLELLLTTPIARAAWHVRTGLGAYLGIVLASLVVALAAAIGVATSGEDLLTPFTGSLVLVLYGTAMAGIGMAAGGWLRPTFAAPAVIIAVVGSLLIDILAPILELPQLVRDLALSSHFGEPMIGNWDPVGIVASLALAIGGLLLGAWGFARRDLSG